MLHLVSRLLVFVLALFCVATWPCLVHGALFVNLTNTDRVKGVAAESEWFWAATEGGPVRVRQSSGEQVALLSMKRGLGAEDYCRVALGAAGTVWFVGPEAGVACFDGISWLDCGPPPSMLGFWYGFYDDAGGGEMECDSFGNVWILGRNVILRFDPIKNEWESLFSQNREYYSPCFAVANDGTVWYMTQISGEVNPSLVAMRDGQKVYFDVPEDWCGGPAMDVVEIRLDARGRVWVLNPVTVARFDGSSWQCFQWIGPSGSADARSMVVGPDLKVWIGAEDGCYMLDEAGWHRFSTATGLPAQMVYELSVDPEGDLLAACAAPSDEMKGRPAGLALYVEKQLRALPSPSLIPANNVDGLKFDDRGDLWGIVAEDFYTDSVLWRLSGDQSSFWLPPVWDGHWGGLCIDNDTKWIGVAYDRYFWRFEGGEWEQIWLAEGLPGMEYDMEVDSQGRLWFIVFHSDNTGVVGMLKDGEFRAFKPPWLHSALTDIAVDADDIVWIPARYISTTVQRRDGAVFICTETDGLTQLDTERWVGPGAVCVSEDNTKWFRALHLLSYSEASGWEKRAAPWDPVWNSEPLFNQHYCSAQAPDGKLWFSERGQLWSFDPATSDWVWLPIELFDECPSDLAIDAYGNVWIGQWGISVLLADESLLLEADAESDALKGRASLSYLGPPTNVDLYVAIQAPSGQVFYVAGQEAAPPFPIFYAAFAGSTEFLQPGPSYSGPGSIPNTPDMKDLAAPPLPLPDPPDGNGPTGLALFAYPVPYYANVPLPAYGAIADLILLNTTLPDEAPAGAYTFHIGLTGPFSIRNVYRSASVTFEVTE